MPVNIVVGTQWGDEGKGKIVDHLAADADWVARCQGGPNAGHTVVIDETTYVLHLIPSGILRPNTRCVIGSGVVVDLEALGREMAMLKAHGCDIDGRLIIDARAHVILPIYKLQEELSETDRGERAIGTTRRGIGPAYEAKVGRRGVRMVDLLDADRLRAAVEVSLVELTPRLRAAGVDQVQSAEAIIDAARSAAADLDGLIGDVPALMHGAVERGERVLVECAQGTFLDIDHGTYPYVTSSTTTAAGACSGLGLGPRTIDHVLGITKAYATRVGRGPFPGELEPAESAVLRQAGAEFGATTGRPRRCGWLDLVALRRAVRLSSVDALAITKLDVLDGREYVRVIVDYESGDRGDWYPETVLEVARPIVETLPGWRQPTAGVREAKALPSEARAYIDFVAQRVGVPVTLVSVGSERDDTVMIGPPAAAGVVS